MTMISRDDLPETPDWSYIPDAIYESPQHRAYIRGTDVALADAEIDTYGTE